jgi:hypothetical protein
MNTVDHYSYEHRVCPGDVFNTSVPGGHKITVEADQQSAGHVGKLHDLPGAAIPDVPQEPWREIANATVHVLPLGRWRIEALVGTLIVRATR